MKRYLLSVTTVLALASMASAAQVNLFFLSSADPNCDTPAEALAGANPLVAPGNNIPIELWMALDTTVMANPTNGFGPMDVSHVGTAAGNTALAIFGARWSALAQAGLVSANPTLTHEGLNILAPAPFIGPGGGSLVTDAANVGPYLLYHIATGSFDGAAGAQLYLQMQYGGTIGINDPQNFNAGAAFGMGPGGPDIGGIADTEGDGVFTHPVPLRGIGQGFLSDTASAGGAIRTALPDLTVIPEPATLSLIGVALLLRRRSRR